MKNKKISREEFLYQVAKLYYIDKISQKKIASMYKVSTATISRAISEAEGLKIVEIKIQDITGANKELENEIKVRYNLKKVIVSVVPHDDEDLIKRIIGKSAASLIYELLKDDMMVGIAWGTSIHEMIKFLKPSYFQNFKVIDLIGNVGKLHYTTSVSSLAKEFAQKFNAKNYFLNSLAIMNNKEARDLLVKEDEIKEVLEMTKNVDIAIISIGLASLDSSIITDLKLGRDIINAVHWMERHSCYIEYFFRAEPFFPKFILLICS